MGVVLTLEQLDTRLRTRDDLERKLKMHPILAEVPPLPDDGNRRSIFIESHPKSAAAESFRILRTNVQFLAVDHAITRVLVTSPFAEDGKTTVSANLAASLAAAGYRTLLVETDLRKPTVHEYFEMAASPGIADVLLGRRTITEAIRPTRIRDLTVLTSGPLPPNPSELLGSQRMVEILDEASALADVIVLDTPPTLPVTDAAVLAPRTDGVILVLRAGRTQAERAKEAIDQIERVGVRVLGLVLNEAPRAESYYYSAYYAEEISKRAGNGSSGDRPAASGTGWAQSEPAILPVENP
jgi:capsular exopolysaccharide synthesis family protein